MAEYQAKNCQLIKIMRLLGMEPHSLELVEFSNDPHAVLFDNWTHETTLVDCAELSHLEEGPSQ